MLIDFNLFDRICYCVKAKWFFDNFCKRINFKKMFLIFFVSCRFFMYLKYCILKFKFYISMFPLGKLLKSFLVIINFIFVKKKKMCVDLLSI